ncbi:MAG: pitrilysin family protein [Gemmatimonadota bacterium]|nr:pitrilysin family protein [Gemmatimonadota bacterium]
MRMPRSALVVLAAVAAAFSAPVPALAQQDAGEGQDVAIPFTKHVLDNGLTLIVHEDRKAPIVAVNVWYHVGSKNEKPGKTGFAHLFEHLMFNGSEHADTDYFQVLEPLGATDLNGTTNKDRTNYFQNVPTSALDVALWMESDRMGHLLGAIDQAKLDEQRGVVQNEKRQGENQPYGRAWTEISENTYPKGHPYSWSVIGSMEDLDAASLEDAHEWFRTYYGPQNAVLVLAGDIDAATAIEKVERYFGDIPPGPPITKHETWIAKRSGEHRQVMQDRVPQARVYMVWNAPEWKHTDADLLDFASSVLASGKTSRLYRRLVYDDQTATSAVAFFMGGEIGSQFMMMGTARPGVDPSVVEAAMREELERFLAEGPTAEELTRVKTQERAGFLRGIERIGGFGGKSDVLAQGEVYAGDPAFYQVRQERLQDATAAEVRDAARRWLSDGVYVLEVRPFPSLAAAAEGVDRAALPVPGTPPAPDFPEVRRATLANGMQVVLAERPGLPLVRMQLVLDAGYAADPAERPGLANLTMDMLDEGTTSRDALEISEELALLGANLGTGANLDQVLVSLSALKENLAPSLALFADVVRNPSFPETDLERLRRQTLARIQQEKSQPMGMAMRTLPPLLYGEGHPYAQPLTGSGTEASVAAITPADLRGYHATWFRPGNATLVVAGDVTLDEIVPELEKAFRGWEAGAVPEKNLAGAKRPDAPVIYLLDRPGSPQSVILAGQLIPPTANPDERAFEVMNTVLGGAFISRINLNLREDKGWSYGARAIAWDAAGPRPFAVYAPVQSDRTAEAMTEILAELNGIRGDRPVTADELRKAVDNLTLSLPGRWETIGRVAGSLGEIVRFGLPDDWFDTYADEVRAVSAEEASAVARDFLAPDRMVWVVVGDRETIEEPVRALGIGEVRLLGGAGASRTAQTD